MLLFYFLDVTSANPLHDITIPQHLCTCACVSACVNMQLVSNQLSNANSISVTLCTASAIIIVIASNEFISVLPSLFLYLVQFVSRVFTTHTVMHCLNILKCYSIASYLFRYIRNSYRLFPG